jgi:hypothetical protein
MTKRSPAKLLVGNSFPLPLVRQAVSIRPWSVRQLRARLARHPVASYWGHANTRSAAESLLGVSLAPATDRPALALSPDRLPCLDGETFISCYVLSPDYRPGFRPAIGSEVSAEDIRSWKLLRIDWLPPKRNKTNPRNERTR